jgi:UDPglucose 6-dehydrogenase
MGDNGLNTSVIGSGYIGTVSVACFAELGHDVKCIDIDPGKVDMINNVEPQIYEEGLEALIKKHAGKWKVSIRREQIIKFSKYHLELV